MLLELFLVLDNMFENKLFLGGILSIAHISILFRFHNHVLELPASFEFLVDDKPSFPPVFGKEGIIFDLIFHQFQNLNDLL